MTNIELFHHYAGHALQALLSNYREQPLSMLDGADAAKNEKEGTYPLQNIDAGGEVWEVLVTLKKKNDGTV